MVGNNNGTNPNSSDYCHLEIESGVKGSWSRKLAESPKEKPNRCRWRFQRNYEPLRWVDNT